MITIEIYKLYRIKVISVVHCKQGRTNNSGSPKNTGTIVPSHVLRLLLIFCNEVLGFYKKHELFQLNEESA